MTDSNDVSEAASTLSVRILDKEYRVSCPPGEDDNLRQSAQFLDKKMREIRHTGKTIGLERIAIMAALNMAHELLLKSQELERTEQYSQQQLAHLMSKVEAALGHPEE